VVSMNKKAVLRAYRHLLRASLEACQYTTPARYAARDIINQAFREQPASAFSPLRVKNTLAFLKRAKRNTGFEHKILKNMAHIRY
ncbi:uncharacterized protein A1O9_07375, partial [Exophiala aquamarina CBS 119918]